LSASVSAPWPPIEWPLMPVRDGSTGNCAATKADSSSTIHEAMRKCFDHGAWVASR